MVPCRPRHGCHGWPALALAKYATAIAYSTWHRPSIYSYHNERKGGSHGPLIHLDCKARNADLHQARARRSDLFFRTGDEVKTRISIKVMRLAVIRMNAAVAAMKN